MIYAYQINYLKYTSNDPAELFLYFVEPSPTHHNRSYQIYLYCLYGETHGYATTSWKKTGKDTSSGREVQVTSRSPNDFTKNRLKGGSFSNQDITDPIGNYLSTVEVMLAVPQLDYISGYPMKWRYKEKSHLSYDKCRLPLRIIDPFILRWVSD